MNEVSVDLSKFDHTTFLAKFGRILLFLGLDQESCLNTTRGYNTLILILTDLHGSMISSTIHDKLKWVYSHHIQAETRIRLVHS